MDALDGPFVFAGPMISDQLDGSGIGFIEGRVTENQSSFLAMHKGTNFVPKVLRVRILSMQKPRVAIVGFGTTFRLAPRSLGGWTPSRMSQQKTNVIMVVAFG